MRVARITSRFGGLPDVYTFECRVFGLTHIEAAIVALGTEGPIHDAFHSSSSLVLHRGSNLRLLVNLRVLPGDGKPAESAQRGGALQTHQQ